VPKDKLTVNGPVKKWKGTGSSGNAVWRWFCGECGSPIAHDPDAAPEIIALKGGSLDSEIKKGLKPVCFVLCWWRWVAGLTEIGHRDLDRRQAAFLPGAPGQAVQAHAGVNGREIETGWDYTYMRDLCGVPGTPRGWYKPGYMVLPLNRRHGGNKNKWTTISSSRRLA
jgi:hypothetical protein